MWLSSSAGLMLMLRQDKKRGQERVSFREISVSINARLGANELSLIEHWAGLPVVRSNLILT